MIVMFLLNTIKRWESRKFQHEDNNEVTTVNLKKKEKIEPLHDSMNSNKSRQMVLVCERAELRFLLFLSKNSLAEQNYTS